MPKIVITAQSIAKAKAASVPGAKQSEITDARSEGLCIRVGARGARWGLRFQLDGKQSRLDLGGIDDWSIAEARDIAAEAQRVMRAGIQRPDVDWVHLQRIRLGKVAAPEAPELDPRLSLKWSWEDGRREYLAHVADTLKERTWADYRSVLGTPELERFAGKPVASISLKAMSAAIADIHRRGVERQAEHVASVIRPMWRWMGHLNQQDLSGLDSPRIMQDLEAPKRTRAAAAARVVKTAPEMRLVARALIIARSGVFHPTVSAALQLLIFGVQRATATVVAERRHFYGIGNGEGLWIMPPTHRKTAEKRRDSDSHIVPLPAPIWSVIERLLDESDTIDTSEYAFPALRPRRAGDPMTSIAASNLQHGLMYMPGVDWTPHDIRRAFAKHGSKAFKWTLAEVKTILDHNEGHGSGDVTRVHYLYDGTDAKWPMMRAWAGLLEEAAAEELRFDKRLEDVDWLKRFIVAERDAHKSGKRPRVSLKKGIKIIEQPMPAEPVAL